MASSVDIGHGLWHCVYHIDTKLNWLLTIKNQAEMTQTSIRGFLMDRRPAESWPTPLAVAPKLPWPWAVPGNGQGNGSMSDHPQERWEKYSRSPSVDEDGTEWFAYGLGVSRWAGWVCLTVNSNDHRPSPFSHCFGQSRYVSTMTAKCLYRLTWDLGTNQILIFVGMHWWLIHVIYTSTCTMWAPGPPRLFFLVNKNPMNTYEYYIGIINHSEIEVMWPPSLFPTW